MDITNLTANLDTRTSFGPSFSVEDATQIEKDASEWDGSRLSCLLTCTRSAENLQDMNAKFPEVFMETYSLIQEYRDHTRRMLAVAEAASRRMELAGGYHPSNNDKKRFNGNLAWPCWPTR